MKNALLLGVVALLVVLAGCTRGATEKSEWTPEQMAEMEGEHGMMSEGMMSEGYREYSKEAFDQATSEGKIVVLDFAANWCPTCQKEGPELMKGVEQLNNPNVVVFKVHFKDDQTTAEHTALAQQYQIPYQHTKVVLKEGKVVLKSPEAWSAARFVEEMKKLG